MDMSARRHEDGAKVVISIRQLLEVSPSCRSHGGEEVNSAKAVQLTLMFCARAAANRRIGGGSASGSSQFVSQLQVLGGG